jgi:hypothetical protein
MDLYILTFTFLDSRRDDGTLSLIIIIIPVIVISVVYLIWPLIADVK